MSRRDDERLEDVAEALVAIKGHLLRGTLHDGLVFDAVRVRLIEIGEAVKAIDPDLLAREPDIAWDDIAGMRDRLAHRYFAPLTPSCKRQSIRSCRFSGRPLHASVESLDEAQMQSAHAR